MDVDRLLELLLHGNQLKRTARTGWVQRGVPLPENVAAHTFGVVYATLLLADLVEQPIDMAAALAMAALHDLPEGLTTDIPTPAWRFLPSGAKTSAERQAMEQIGGETPTTHPATRVREMRSSLWKWPIRRSPWTAATSAACTRAPECRSSGWWPTASTIRRRRRYMTSCGGEDSCQCPVFSVQ